jgi:phosphoglycolate phosphatase
MSKLVMLDFDGVIADSFEPTCVVTLAAFEEYGFARLATREAFLSLVEANWFEGLRDAGVPQEVADDIDDRVARVVHDGGLVPYAAMPGVIASLAEHHHVLIVTSNRSDIVEAFLAQWHIRGVREVLGCDKGQGKVPKISGAVRRFAEEAASRPGAVDSGGPEVAGAARVDTAHATRADTAPESWFVGDTVGDMLEGRAAGVGTIAVGWGWHTVAQLAGAAPDHLVGEPADLLTLLL